MTKHEIILIHSPLVGPNSLLPTAKVLEYQGHMVSLPSPYLDGEFPAWRDWPQALRSRLTALNEPVFVGHSMASLLAARLAADYERVSICCLDGEIPPDSGPTPPVAESFRPFLANLPATDGKLPPWDEWWPTGVFGGRDVEEALEAQVTSDIPTMTRDWFHDEFEMPSWDHARKGFVKLDVWFESEFRRAAALGWSAVAIDGIHLEPAIEPEKTAAAIIDCIAGMSKGDRS